MNLHLAAVYANDMDVGGRYYHQLSDTAKAHRAQVPYILESYHYFNKAKQVDRVRRSGEKVFLDSGAFSAWSQGVSINLPQYCKFIQDHGDILTIASVLDVIGSAEGTWANQQHMERLGTRPIPCFHYGEDLRWGHYYANNYEYIALGGFGVATRQQMGAWLDEVWSRVLTDGAGRPRCKVHGFAITAVPLMERYPWYSVDSSSWVQISSVGGVIDPDYGVLSVSRTSPNRKMEGQHINTFSEVERQRLIEHFAGVGYTLQELQDGYLPRRTYCMWAYTELNRRIQPQSFVKEQVGLFA